MSTYTIRPTSLLYRDNTVQGTSNSGSSWGTASDTQINTYVSDASDTTGIRSNGSGSRNLRLALGSPSLASDEFICRVAGFVRWSAGSNGKYIGVMPYALSGMLPPTLANINTDGRVTLTTTEPGYRYAGWENTDGTNLGIALSFDGNTTAALRPFIWEAGATIYTLQRATAAPQNTTMSSSTFATIPVNVTATIDWEASTYPWQNLRKVTVEVRVESGGGAAGSGQLVSTTTSDIYFDATGTTTVSVTMPDSLPNGTYKVYARAIRHRENETSVAADQIGVWSSGATLTMTVTPPDTPTISVSADDTNARVEITVTPVSSSGYTSPYITVERSIDSGSTWTTVRGLTALGALFDSPSIRYDYEAPRGTTVQYRARVSAYTSGVLNTSASTNAVSATLTASNWNLKCPLSPNLNMIDVKIVGQPSEDVSEDIGVFRPFGRRYAVVVSGTLSGYDGDLTIATSSDTEWEQVKALVESQAVLFLESPFGTSKYIRLTQGAKTTILGTATAPRRRITLSYVETTTPTGSYLTNQFGSTADGGSSATSVWDETWDGGIASTSSFADSVDGGTA